jgi:hypothetical protein
VLHRLPVERVQDRMACPVSSSRTPIGLATY